MTAEATAAAPVAAGGWQINTGFAVTALPAKSRSFYAVYSGADYGHPERGIIAAMARAHPEAEHFLAGGREAAQLVIHGVAEGYFGARRTLSSRRAAGIAITSINRWLFGQARTDTARHLVPVSLTALMFHNRSIGIAQVGSCLMYRYRSNRLDPLMRDHTRPLADGRSAPTRAVGLDLELSVDYAEEPAEAADRYIIVSGFEAQSHEAIYTAMAERLRQGSTPPDEFAKTLLSMLGNETGTDKTAMVLDVLQLPPPGMAVAMAELAGLPLRPAPREGDVWDGFQIGRTLYQGRYTVLKAAYDSIENRDVALKIPLPSMLQDEVFAAGFMREAWIGTTVRGSNIARYLELPPERRSSLYLVMPLYHGETLEARLHRGPVVSLPEGAGIALKLCEALQDLAAIQVIHRDIKPDNIMLLARNEVRLLDLGLAYLPGIDTAESVKPGGTLRYMAPELLRGVTASARSEVYSLAVTIYRMFTGGAYPFGQREGVPLARLRPDLPHWLGQVLRRALSPQPGLRFADAAAFAEALQQGLAVGMENETLPPGRFSGITKLHLWQAAALLFAGGFFILLIKVLG